MGECPVCLSAIATEDEAFLDTCLHRFHLKCIRQWTATQRQHPVPSTSSQPQLTLHCPLCRQRYIYFIHDCRDRTFQIEWADPSAQAQHAASLPPGCGMQLTAAQRRRRSRYTQHAPPSVDTDTGTAAQAANQDPTALQSVPSSSVTRTTNQRPARPRPPRLVSDPLVSVWLRRELQALLLEENVSVVLAAVMGALTSSHSQAPAKKPQVTMRIKRTLNGGVKQVSGPSPPQQVQAPTMPPGAATPAPGDAPAAGATATPLVTPPAHTSHTSDTPPWHKPLVKAATPFLGTEDAECFAHELAGFLKSGLSIEAYDRSLFDRHTEADPGAAGGSTGSADGTARNLREADHAAGKDEAASTDVLQMASPSSSDGVGGSHHQRTDSSESGGESEGVQDELTLGLSAGDVLGREAC